jgi:hypothetical protein
MMLASRTAQHRGGDPDVIALPAIGSDRLQLRVLKGGTDCLQRSMACIRVLERIRDPLPENAHRLDV